MEFEFLLDGEPRKVGVERRDASFVFRIGEAMIEATVRQVSTDELLFSFGGRTARIHLVRDCGRTLVSVAGHEFTLTEPQPGTAAAPEGDERSPEGCLKVKAPMPGKVIKICVREGENVRRNQTLAVVEAMKMENEIQSPIEGTVKSVQAAVGELVDQEKTLLEIECKELTAKRRTGP
jgi:biotin carboxyl carrier protein